MAGKAHPVPGAALSSRQPIDSAWEIFDFGYSICREPKPKPPESSFTANRSNVIGVQHHTDPSDHLRYGIQNRRGCTGVCDSRDVWACVYRASCSSVTLTILLDRGTGFTVYIQSQVIGHILSGSPKLSSSKWQPHPLLQRLRRYLQHYYMLGTWDTTIHAHDGNQRRYHSDLTEETHVNSCDPKQGRTSPKKKFAQSWVVLRQNALNDQCGRINEQIVGEILHEIS